MVPLETVSPTETLDIDSELSLVPRVKLTLTIHPLVSSITKPIDEWQLKRALIDFLKTSLTVSVTVTVTEEDIVIRRPKDLKKRKREDPVAHGTLFIRDLGFLDKGSEKREGSDEKKEHAKLLENKFLDWRKYAVEKMDGIELNLEGVKYKLTVAVPESDDFEKMVKEWEEFYAFGGRGYSRGGKEEADTIIVRGVPSRWFAEPRVSSKPSMLVTHTIFSTFGKIRSLNVGEDNDLGKNVEDDTEDLITGLNCKIVVQFERYKDFYNTLKVLCGRSLQKQGSRLKADYEVTWDKDGIFKNSRNQSQEKISRIRPTEREQYRSEAPRRESYKSRFTSDDSGRKRFKE